MKKNNVMQIIQKIRSTRKEIHHLRTKCVEFMGTDRILYRACFDRIMVLVDEIIKQKRELHKEINRCKKIKNNRDGRREQLLNALYSEERKILA